MPKAGEVFLVWGINGWAVVPEENRPAGTLVKDKVMHTPMAREGDVFIIRVQVPAGATIDYGFLITRERNGAAVQIWEANGEQDCHITATEDGVVEVQTTLTLAQDQARTSVADTSLVNQEIHYHMPRRARCFSSGGSTAGLLWPRTNARPGRR